MKSAQIEKAMNNPFKWAGLLLLAVLIGWTFAAGPAAAHAPGAMSLAYDSSTQTLKVLITHTSKTPTSHYVSKVEIMKNGKVVSVHEYKSQPTQETFSYDYKIPVGGSDTVTVKATCNRFGSITESLNRGPSKEPR
jgi:hypothetical protein